jgi:hypothetical protein
MNYGNTCQLSNNVVVDECSSCNQKIDKHKIPLIQSDDATEKLAQKVQQNLNAVYAQALTMGYEIGAPTMVGAAIATVGSKVVKVVALSGANAGAVLGRMPSNLGQDVVIVGDNVTAFRTVTGAAIQPNVAPIPGGFNYPLGACAAQKVLMEIIRQANPQGGSSLKISNLRLAEIFWKTNGTKSNWSSGEVVPSCDTCKRVVPMLLCDKS